MEDEEAKEAKSSLHPPSRQLIQMKPQKMNQSRRLHFADLQDQRRLPIILRSCYLSVIQSFIWIPLLEY